MNVPEFGQFVEYVMEGYEFHHVSLTQQNLDQLDVLETVQADYAKVAAIGRQVELTPDELAALKLAVPYHADVIENEITSTNPQEIIANLIEVRSRPDWTPWIVVKVDEVYFYNGNLYKVIQAHTTQPDWTPDITPALWKRFYEISAGPQPWVQPTGAHDAYNTGDRVTYNGHLWESLIDANVWSPTVYPAGWKDLGVYP